MASSACPPKSLPALLIAPLLVVLLACRMGAALAAGEIRFAPEKDYGPFVYQTAEGRVEGLSIDILEAVKSGLDSPVLMLPAQPLAAILEAARRGEVDLISSLRPTPERSAYLAFTSPYVQVPAVLVVRQSVSPAVPDSGPRSDARREPRSNSSSFSASSSCRTR